MATDKPPVLDWDNDQIELWIDEAREGSPTALGHLLEACQSYLADLAKRRVSSPLRCKVSASDLVQETSLDAHRDFANFRGARLEELLAWLRQILLFNAANASRRYRGTAKRAVSREIALEAVPEVAEHLQDDALSPRSLLAADEERRAVEGALERLTADQKTVILLRSREHFSFVEIGDFMHRSADAARKLWFRAIERLQQELQDPHDDV